MAKRPRVETSPDRLLNSGALLSAREGFAQSLERAWQEGRERGFTEGVCDASHDETNHTPHCKRARGGNPYRIEPKSGGSE